MIGLIIALCAFLTSLLTLFSGFGLGTLLMPVFAIFFPVELAVMLTAIVHFLNNLFKLALLGKFADKKIILQFGVPAIASAFLGAKLLLWFSGFAPIYTYSIQNHLFSITQIKLILAVLIAVFAIVEILPSFGKLSFDRKWLPLGGVLSGFLGGVSGHQGALRSAFLIRCNLSKETFIGTGVVIASLIDLSRLSYYLTHITHSEIQGNISLLIITTLAAFAGAWAGNRYLKKITLEKVQSLVSILLFFIAFLLAAGII